MDSVTLLEGTTFLDKRGVVTFNNSLDFAGFRRLYMIENFQNKIRAWQGHKIEKKIFIPISGTFYVALTKIDDWNKPSPDLVPEEYLISSRKNHCLLIPSGYANGFKALECPAKLMVLSSLTIEESKEDDFRFSPELWMDWSKV